MFKSIFHFRVIKTVCATFLALMLGYTIFQEYTIFIALAACFCIRQTFMGSIKQFVTEVKMVFVATLISMFFGGVLELLEEVDYLVAALPVFHFLGAALAMGAVVALVQHYKWYDSVFVGLLTVAFILLVPAGEKNIENYFLARGAIRFGRILLGSSCALATDFVFSGVEYKNLFHYRLKQVLNSLDDMLELFVEAIMFQDKEMTTRTLDIMVKTQNLLNYVDDKLDDLESELGFRGDNIGGFNRTQLSLLQDILRDFRLISFQLEAGAINYIELLEIMDREAEEEAFPEANYSKISAKGRDLAKTIFCLKNAVDNEDPDVLDKIRHCETKSIDYRYLFEEMEDNDVRLLAIDTLSSIGRVEFHLCKAADLVYKYLQERKQTA